MILSINEEIEILLLDDQSVERELISEILTYIGCQVTKVNTEHECIRIFKKKKYDLVIFDEHTPSSNIHSFVTKLSEIDSLTPIAMMVSMDTGFYSNKYGESNIDFLISRPFGHSELQNLVKEAVELSKRLKKTSPPVK